jgi:hypothetical protein
MFWELMRPEGRVPKLSNGKIYENKTSGPFNHSCHPDDAHRAAIAAAGREIIFTMFGFHH